LSFFHCQQIVRSLPKKSPFAFPQPRQDFSFNRDVFRWLGRRGLRHLLDLQRAGEPVPSHEELTVFLWKIALEEGKDNFISEVDQDLDALVASSYSRMGVPVPPEHQRSTFDQFHESWLKRTGPQQAAWVLKKFDADFLKRASNGGKLHGPRAPKTTVAQMREFDGSPAHEVAAKLNIALSSVYRIRKKIRDSDEMPQDDSRWYVPEQFDTPIQI
jgi:hypothetical protein